MAIQDLLQRILKEPSPDDLWQLQPHLLVLDTPAAESAREMARLFYCYLSCVRSKLTAKQYSALAAMLAAGSVGMIAVEDVIEAFKFNRQAVVSELLSSGLAAGFETFSAFQHVKAWEAEFASVHEEAVWQVYHALWQISAEMQPDLDLEKRHALIDSLLAVVRDPGVDSQVRLALMIRLLQILLALRLSQVAAARPAAAEA